MDLVLIGKIKEVIKSFRRCFVGFDGFCVRIGLICSVTMGERKIPRKSTADYGQVGKVIENPRHW